MIRASDFMGVMRGQFDYLFFLVWDSYWIRYTGPNSLNHVIEDVFARRLGHHGAVVTSFSEDIEKNYHLIMTKNWPPEVRERLDTPSDPKLLVIATDFARFDPEVDPFILVDFACYDGDSHKFIDVLREIEEVVTKQENLFEWWRTEATKGNSFVKRAAEAVELKPGLWGFAFDIKKFFRWR